MSICDASSKTDYSGVVSFPAEQDPICQEIPAILAKHRDSRAEIIAILEEIQERFGYLPERALRMVSERTGSSLVDIYGIATFYRLFSLKPRGKHLICACMGTACHVRGAARIVEELQRQLGIHSGETTDDGRFTLETVNCLGACAVGPVVVIDGHCFSKVHKQRVRRLLDEALKGFAKGNGREDWQSFPFDVSCVRCKRSLMDADVQLDGRPAIRVIVSSDGQQGLLRLSSVYGSENILSECDVAAGKVVKFLCPHCHEDLANGSSCPTCHAPMMPMAIHAGGVVQVCSRRGCRGSRLDLDGVDEHMEH